MNCMPARRRLQAHRGDLGVGRPGGARVLGRLMFFLVALFAFSPVKRAEAQTVKIDATPGHAVNSFSPLRALGAGVDRLRKDATDKLFVEPVLKESLSSGWGTVSYRQNTELHVEAWHWNPKGTWSDPAGQGYFTGAATPTEIIRHSYAYPLPHRGFTRNQGTERGFSRLTDGDTASYWKSNPYLTKPFTGEDDSLHPQWVVLDLEEKKEINAIRIAWAEPYAKAYQVQYWTGPDAMNKQAEGAWETFAGGTIANGTGGTATLNLCPTPLSIRYVRVVMTESSNTCDTHDSADRRNCLGYAISEIYIGALSEDGTFNDIAKHSPDQKQTLTLCSSVDPWHAASDLSEDAGDQVGLDLFFTSGITRGLPAMVPVAMFYGTPEDAAAQMAYLKKRGYPISYVELGEEPDGQYMQPEDYAALYLQWATALHKVDPAFKLGGPVFEGVNEDIQAWPDKGGKTSWFGRFIDYLKAHGHLGDLAFMSLEHYPFEACDVPWEGLYDEPRLISHILQVWRDDGLPPEVPIFITEVNISWEMSQPFVDVFGALWQADYIAAFLSAGGAASYYFQYLPLPLAKGCHDSWGTFGMFTVDSDYRVKQHTSQFFARQMITREWAKPVDAQHKLFPATCDIKDSKGNTLVTAYPLLRPDRQWAVMLANKDRDNPHQIRIEFQDAKSGRTKSFSGPVAMITFGSEQYQWHPDGKNGHADPDGPPARSSLKAAKSTKFTLPKASVTVLRGKIR